MPLEASKIMTPYVRKIESKTVILNGTYVANYQQVVVTKI